MVDVATAQESTGALASRVPLTLKPTVGYCADCGTWDAHGRFCVACGYDFAPAPDQDMPNPAL